MSNSTDRKVPADVGRLAALLLVLGFGLVFGVQTAAAQVSTGPDSPAADTVSKRPFVLLLLDSSASMEWTQEGAGEYPNREKAYDAINAPDPYPNQPDEFEPGDELGVGNGGDLAGQYDSSDNPLMFGPCFVWEPPASNYERPGWKVQNNNARTERYSTSHPMGTRLRGSNYMRGDSNDWGSTGQGVPVRLLNNNQPRHVSFKEILTGEMVLAPADRTSETISSINYKRYGPGCWFVPRQRGVRNIEDPVYCETETTVTQPDDTKVTICDNGYEKFESLPDHTDPRPHMQEVFDGQIDNGLIDNLNEQMHFAVTSFDSYKFPMDGSSKGAGIDSEDTVLWRPYDPNNTDTHELSDKYNSGKTAVDEPTSRYNMGVYQIVGPDEFPTSTSDLKKINRMVQKSIVDTGTLKNRAYDDPNSQTTKNQTFVHEPQVGSKAGSVLMSRQPISRNTPISPAIHDIHDYFMDPDGPIQKDKFSQCRPKHTVMLTDGMPLPEKSGASGTQCVDVGEESLQEPFSIDKNEYDYQCTEKTITDFVTDSDLTGSGISSRYQPRVHVVGINQREWNETTDKPVQVKKLASMAEAGKTCAGWYLGNRTESEENQCGEGFTGSGESAWIPDDSTSGYCSDPDHPCLVQQYPYDDGSGSQIDPPQSFSSFGASGCPPSGWQGCEFPAIILTCNTMSENRTYYSNNGTPGNKSIDEAAREAFQECRSGKWNAKALQQVFNSIAESSGLASRTQAAVTNELDDPNQSQSGQYRFYSGVRVESTTPVWRGVLFREERLCKAGSTGTQQIDPSDKEDPCASGNNVYECFHREIGNQIERDPNSGKATQDNRRIFTSVSETRTFDYKEGEGESATNSSCGLFHSTYMMEDGGDGEMQQTYLEASSSDPDQIVDRRIPFAETPLREALVSQGNETKPVGDSNADNDNSSQESLYSYFRTSSSQFDELLQSVRAQVPQRDGSELGGILNSTPVTVPPPKLDVPMRSYREFKQRFQQRPTMLYFATLDGMLHATHSGVLTDQIKVRQDMSTDEDNVFTGNPYSNLNSKEQDGDAVQQREAWAYIPQILHDDFAQYQDVNPNLMDSTPTVKNVRLCDSKLSNNQNFQACRSLCSDSRDLGSMCQSGTNPDCVPRPLQWRTVLVQGLGQAGSGYFALDVTRPGGPHTDTSGNTVTKRPDPIPLWEFDPSWEKGQLDHMIGNSSQFESDGDALVSPATTQQRKDANKSSCDADKFWKQPFLGQSVSEPAIGTLVLPPVSDGNAPLRRSVSVFGAGDFGSYGTTNCKPEARVGKAAYVVDMQTGSMLRRFVGYNDPYDGGTWKKFDAPIVGSPTLYKSRPGRLASRGFIGDAEGRLYRIEFSGSAESTPEEQWDPANWELTLFFDPSKGGKKGQCEISGDPSAANLKPAVAENASGNPVVVYGLGDPSDTPSKTEAHTMLAVEETIDSRKDDAQGECIWHISQDQKKGFRENEKVTGEPIIFNNAAYFTSYYLDDKDVCSKGNSRVWGVQFGSPGSGGPLPDGVYNCSTNPKLSQLSTCQSRYFEPNQNTIIRGLTITLGPACNATPGNQATARLQEGNDQDPQLIVQTGGSEPSTSSGSGSGSGGTGAGSDDFVHRMSVGISDDYRRTIPLSWSVVN